MTISTYRTTCKGKSIPKRQRPTEVNTVLASAGGDSRIEIPPAPTKNPKSETTTSTSDDAELLKGLRGLGKPPLVDGNDTDVSFLPVSEDDSILLRHMDDVVDTGPDEHHRAIGEMDNQMNQHIEIPQIQYTDKVADESVAVQQQISPKTHRDQGHPSISGMTDQVETQTRTSKAKPLPNAAGQKGRIR